MISAAVEFGADHFQRHHQRLRGILAPSLKRPPAVGPPDLVKARPCAIFVLGRRKDLDQNLRLAGVVQAQNAARNNHGNLNSSSGLLSRSHGWSDSST